MGNRFGRSQLTEQDAGVQKKRILFTTVKSRVNLETHQCFKPLHNQLKKGLKCQMGI